MANNKGFLSASELDFDAVKQNLKTYLQQQEEFKDYDFEGSNLSVLLDLLAYNTYMNAAYLNMVGSEMFLDTALLRESIVSHAKELNYVPRSRVAAKANIEIVITPSDSPSTITIPQHYRLTTTVGSNTYDFVVLNEIVVKPVNNVYTTGEITVNEAKPVYEFFTTNTTVNSAGFTRNNTRMYIQSANADISTFKVDVAESGNLSDFDNGLARSYQQANSLFGLNNSDRVFFVQGYKDNMYEIVLGNGTHGRAPQNGEIVRVHYHDTVGPDANRASVFNKTTSIEGYSNISVTTKSVATGGAERESNNEIKFNAVRHFQTQERAVTASDFVNLILSKFPAVQAAIAYGGEEIKQYGKVIISVKPYGVVGNVTDTLKDQIKSFLNQKSLTTEPVIVDPEYFYVQILSTVNYNPQQTTQTEDQLKSNILSTIGDFNTSTLSNFGRDLHASKVIAAIDDVSDAIVSNDTDINIVKRWTPTVGKTVNLSFTFNNRLHQHDIQFEYPEGHLGTITSTVFQYEKDGVTYNSYLRDNGVGNVHIHTFNNDGTRLYLANNIGTVDYTTGTVDLNANVAGYSGYIGVIGDLETKSIYATRNNFLIIDTGDVTVTMNEVTE